MERSFQEVRGQGEFSRTFFLGLKVGGEEEQVLRKGVAAVLLCSRTFAKQHLEKGEKAKEEAEYACFFFFSPTWAFSFCLFLLSKNVL